MKTKLNFLTLLALLVLTACAKDSDGTGDIAQEQEVVSPYKTDGFIISSLAQSTAGYSYFVGYSETEPTGALDLTEHNSFSGYWPETIYKNFAYGPSLDTDNTELNRYAVDNITGLIIKAGTIPLTSFLGHVKILSDDVGVYTVYQEQKLFVFNPMNMEFIREIDLSQGAWFTETDDHRNSYYSIIYRPQDNKIFLPLYTDIQTTGQFYDHNDIFVEVIDMNSMSWEGTAVYEEATYPLTRGMENSVVDEQGNIYITCQGQYSLDGQAGPTAAKRSRPQILKIPAGSIQFDSSYSFNPVDYLGFNFIVAQLFTGTIYGANGIAYAAISAKPDDPRVLELLQLLATGQITEGEMNELRNIVINGPNSKWAKLDLNAQSATVIEDIPFTAGFGYPMSYKYDDKMYFQVLNEAEGINGYYEYDPATNTSRNLYNVAAGGIATQLVKLSE